MNENKESCDKNGRAPAGVAAICRCGEETRQQWRGTHRLVRLFYVIPPPQRAPEQIGQLSLLKRVPLCLLIRPTTDYPIAVPNAFLYASRGLRHLVVPLVHESVSFSSGTIHSFPSNLDMNEEDQPLMPPLGVWIMLVQRAIQVGQSHSPPFLE